MATDYIESAGVKDVIGVKLIGANSQIVDSATLAEQQIQSTALSNILTAVSSRFSFAETVWQDANGVYWKWRSYQDPNTFAIVDQFIKSDGTIGTPTGLLTPAASSGVFDTPVNYDVLVSGTGYSAGQQVSKSILREIAGGAVLDIFWFNTYTDTVINPADIDMAKLEQAGETINIKSATLGDVTDAMATDPTASGSVIQLLKAVFKWTKGTRGAGNVDADTQRVAVATSPSTAVNSMPVTATSTESSFAFDANTNFILVSSGEVDCWVKVGASPVTATIGGSGCRQIFAGSTYVIPVTPGHKIAVIGPAFAAGYLTVDERQ